MPLIAPHRNVLLHYHVKYLAGMWSRSLSTSQSRDCLDTHLLGLVSTKKLQRLGLVSSRSRLVLVYLRIVPMTLFCPN